MAAHSSRYLRNLSRELTVSALPGLCWAAGALRPSTEFRPHLGDRAFRYGDGVFATLLLRRGRLLEAEAHVARLATSASAIGLEVPEAVSSADRLCDVLGLIGAGETDSCVVRIQVSAVSGRRGYGRDGGAAWELVELHPLPAARRLSVAVLGTHEAPLPALPAVKSCSAVANVLCAAGAERHGVAEAVRRSGDLLLEATAANLFWEADGELFTPAATLPLYPGVTRGFVIDAARRAGWTVNEGEFGPLDLERSEGAFLTNAVRGIEPIVEIDGERFDWPPALETLRAAVEEARTDGGNPIDGRSDRTR